MTTERQHLAHQVEILKQEGQALMDLLAPFTDENNWEWDDDEGVWQWVGLDGIHCESPAVYLQSMIAGLTVIGSELRWLPPGVTVK